MRIPIRKTFATLLFATSLMPATLIAGFHLGSPTTVYDASVVGGVWLTRALWIGLGVLAVALLVYPPFLPFLRLRFGAAWRKLGTDRGPMLDGVARLRHLETHADRLLVGRMARQLGDYPTAIENLTRAYQLDPSHVSGRYQLGLLFAELGQLPDAVKILDSVVGDDEKHAFGDALLHLGKSLFRLRQDQTALAVLRRHQTLFPGSRQVHLLVARTLADLGEKDAAAAELKLAAHPASEGEHLSAEENLARAQAKVTFLRAPSGDHPSQTTEDES